MLSQISFFHFFLFSFAVPLRYQAGCCPHADRCSGLHLPWRCVPSAVHLPGRSDQQFHKLLQGTDGQQWHVHSGPGEWADHLCSLLRLSRCRDDSHQLPSDGALGLDWGPANEGNAAGAVPVHLETRRRLVWCDKHGRTQQSPNRVRANPGLYSTFLTVTLRSKRFAYNKLLITTPILLPIVCILALQRFSSKYCTTTH